MDERQETWSAGDFSIVRNSKKIFSNTAPTAPTLSTRFISTARNSQSAILSAVFSNRLTISPP